MMHAAGLVRDCHPFFNARFACRVLHPFLGNRAQLDDGRSNGLIDGASTSRVIASGGEIKVLDANTGDAIA